MAYYYISDDLLEEIQENFITEVEEDDTHEKILKKQGIKKIKDFIAAKIEKQKRSEGK